MNPATATDIKIPSFGIIKGFLFPDGMRKFCGIPYGRLQKRWTRSSLNTSLSNAGHDGTKYGAISPQPPEYNAMEEDLLVPVPPLQYMQQPLENDLDCLNLNVFLPPGDLPGPYPVMVWIHGGSLLFGHSSTSAYDMVSLVRHSVEIGSPIAGVSINYRTGLFGFLASQVIKDDLEKDGYAGVGNFGFTDQQVALEWIHQYIEHFGGDKYNVTIFGESAGGMSVAHQVYAANPAPLHRAISMSGNLNTIPVVSMGKHEQRWEALLKHLGIPSSGQQALEALRALPQDRIAAATCPIEGMVGTTGNPCSDGWYHAVCPSPSAIYSPPSWLQSYMTGDVKDEAMIFRQELTKDEDLVMLQGNLIKYLGKQNAEVVCREYSIPLSGSVVVFLERFEELATDVLFVIQNWLHVQRSNIGKTYVYHMDQASTLDNLLKGLAYHAIDLLYVFPNMMDKMTEGQQKLARKVSADFINFAYGRDPWERYSITGQHYSMIYGPGDKWTVKTEEDDEENSTRKYSRMRRIIELGILDKLVECLDDFVQKRWRLGKSKI